MSTTEAASNYDNLEKRSVRELLTCINREDAQVHQAVEKVLPTVAEFVERLVERMRKGGRMFYLGAGTSGRLGILDASELPPTYGVPHGLVIALIAGGPTAIQKAVENAEDDETAAWQELKALAIGPNDTVVGIAASGKTPYVIGGVKAAKAEGLLTAGITCNAQSPLAQSVDFPMEVVVGPEFVTGSTRMKAGTAQKMVLNMISTTAMIGLGRVKGNKMIDMQLSNQKLVDRGTRMLMEALPLPYEEARELLVAEGSVRQAIDSYSNTSG
ncbi:N-acetylmuramic acid 6-phosphate etherase [Rapidithrix thailandica]|uniref:N-acetylmuramic acid 6-phosphate etherase n=1 Tax=Rapidithrix thailandica TaxID=413964 RepID=A0AAW9SDV6_9BACT